MKNIIKKCFPKELYMKCRLLKNNYKKNWTFKKFEKETDGLYYNSFEQHIDWENPVRFTEKLCYNKIYGVSEQKQQLSDKLWVKKYIADTIGEEYVVPLIGEYDAFDDIDFSALPKQFVIKCNHDSGSTVIVKDKDSLDLKKLKAKLEFARIRNYALVTDEFQYYGIKAKIIIEEYIGDDVQDFKFMCFHGEPKLFWVDYDRFTRHKRNVYDLNCQLQPYSITFPSCDRPLNRDIDYGKMINLVKILCKDFDNVRVDFYYSNGKVYFGEFTFSSASGFCFVEPVEWDYKLGELWNLEALERRAQLRDKKITQICKFV